MLLYSLHLKESLRFFRFKIQPYLPVTDMTQYLLTLNATHSVSQAHGIKGKEALATDIPFLELLGRSFFSSYHLRDAGTGTVCLCAGRRLNR